MKRFLIVFLFFVMNTVFSQGEANIWYFGQNAGLDFNSGTPVTLSNSAMNTFEGCSTISDSAGNLLFYSDGITVYDRTHNAMLNGTGLLGSFSATQSGIIVPYPNNPNLYYIFTQDSLAMPNGLRYSIIDMSLNGSFGAVTSTKNVLLATPMLESITAVAHGNGNDIWVVAHRHNSNEFLSYLVDNNGINTTPIVSATGYAPVFSYEGQTCMKISPNGQKIAIAFLAEFNNYLQISQFDNITGLITNSILIDAFDRTVTNGPIYGVEFSPNSNLLYASGGSFGLEQYNVSQHNFSSINNSKIQVHTNSVNTPTPVEEYSSLQLGPDGKIYVAHFDSVNLGTIEFPNLSGLACNYQFGTITLASGTKSYSGLPPFITTIFAPAITVENSCLGDVTTFQLDANQAIGSASWDFGDGTTSSQLNPSHTYAATGDYTVSVDVTSSSGIATTSTIVSIYEVPVATAPQEILVCDVNNDGIAVFDLTMQDVSILNGQSTTTFEVVYFENLITYGNNNPIANPTNYSNTTAYAAQSIVASVRNRNNSLCEANTTFNIRVFDTPMPQLTVPTIAICDNDSVGSDMDGLTLFDLTSNETIILNGQSPTDFEIIYYSDAALSTVISNPTAYRNVNRIETIYLQMINRYNNSCTATSSFIIEVLPLPVVNSPVLLSQCDDDTDAISVFNLNEVRDEITTNISSNTITFHNNQVDAENGINEITNPTSYINTTPTSEILFARVENSNGCYRLSQVNLQVTTSQIPASFSRTLYQCDDGVDLYDGIATFDLTTTQTDIAALYPSGQPIAISYYRSELDALTELNPITNISAYQNIGSPSTQNIYVRVDNTNNNDCIGLGQVVTLVVEQNPFSTGPIIIEQCDVDNDGTEAIDTSTINAQLLQGQTGVDLVFTDATGAILPNPLPNPLVTGSQVINVAMTNANSLDADGACTVITTINIFIDAGVVANAIAPLDVCDDNNDGLFSFNTAAIESTLLGSQTGVSVTYEDQNGNVLPSPLPNPFTTSTQTITATVINPSNSFCFAQTNIAFIVNSTPVANTIANDIVCDDISNDGIHLYDLTTYNSQILNGQSDITFSITYHDSQADADTGLNPLPSLYSCTTTLETMYARISNRNNANCARTTSFQIGVFRQPIANAVNNLETCDDNSNDGKEIFDLVIQDSIILSGQSAADNTITYHNSLVDAESGINSLPSNYENRTNPQTVYARVENRSNNSCYAITSFSLVVYEQPVLLMKDDWTICENSTVEIIADSGFDNYLWSTGETSETIVVNTPGNYTVTVSNDYGTLTCEDTKSITVIESTVAVITNVEVQDWSQDNNSVVVEVSGTGDYEYSLDGISYQSSNSFNNLAFGDYQIFVRDINGCGITSQDMFLIFYPRYFTPNGDGYHDFWQLYNSEVEPENKIYIYDRFGKLLKQISALSSGWDGTFNGNPLPSSDYWFVVERQNGLTYRGHFTLKR